MAIKVLNSAKLCATRMIFTQSMSAQSSSPLGQASRVLLAVLALVLAWWWLAVEGGRGLDRQVAMDQLMTLQSALDLAKRGEAARSRSLLQSHPALAAAVKTIPDPGLADWVLKQLQAQLRPWGFQGATSRLTGGQHLVLGMAQAMLALAQGQTDRSLALFEKHRDRFNANQLRETMSLRVGWHYLNGLILAESERWDAASVALLECLKHDPYHQGASRLFINCLEALGGASEAQIRAIDLCEGIEKHARILWLKGLVSDGLATMRRACDLREHVYEVDPTMVHQNAWIGTLQECGYACQLVGDHQAAIVFFEKAHALLKQIAEEAPDDWLSDQIAQNLLAQATVKLQSGQPEKALQNLVEAQSALPISIVDQGHETKIQIAILHQRAHCLLGLQRLEEAKQAYLEVATWQRLLLEQGRDNYPSRLELAMALNNLAVIEQWQGELSPAQSHLLEAINLLSHKPEVVINSAASATHGRLNILFLLGMTLQPQGLSVYTHPCLVRQDMEQETRVILAKLMLNQAQLHEKMGQFPKAMKELSRVAGLLEYLVEFDDREGLISSWAQVLQRLAWEGSTHVQATMRDGSSALRYALKACALTGWKNPDTLVTLAAAHAETGAFDEAVRWQSKAMERVNAQQRPTYENYLEAFKASRPIRQDRS